MKQILLLAAEFHDSTKVNYVNKYFSIEHQYSWSNLIVHSNKKNIQNPLRIYMIDRRYFTADSLTVIEVRAYKFAEY